MRGKHGGICMILVAFLSLSVDAQSQWVHYTAMNDITDFCVDGQYVWCATANGIIRWNCRDSTFTKYTTANGLPASFIRCIASDRRGGIWLSGEERVIFPFSERTPTVIGTGAIHFNGTNWSTYHDPFMRYSDRLNWVSNIVKIHVDRQNAVWFSVPTPVENGNFSLVNTLMKFDGATWKGLREEGIDYSPLASSIESSNDGSIWLSDGWGLERFHDSAWSYLQEGDLGLSSQAIRDMEIDPEGTIHMLNDNGHQYFDGEIWVDGLKKGYDLYKSIAPVSINEIWTLDEHYVNYYVGTDYTDFRKYSHTVVSPRSTVRKLLLDVSGGILAASDHGLARFDGIKWKLFLDDWNIQNTQRMLVLSNGKILVKYKAFNVRDEWDDIRMAFFDGKMWNVFPFSDFQIPQDAAPVAEDSRGRVLFQGDSGLFRFDGVKAENIGYETVLGKWWSIMDVKVDHNDVIWINKAGQLYSQSGTTQQIYVGKKGISDIHIDCSNVKWFGTKESGLLRYDDSEWKNYPMPDNSSISKVTSDSKRAIWLANARGVYRLDNDNIILVREFGENARYVWPIVKINALVADRNDVVWVGTNYGVYRLDREGMTFLTEADGLLNNSVDDIWVTKENGKWFLTGNGFACLTDKTEPTRIQTNSKLSLFLQNIPNPFNLSTSITVSLPISGDVALSIYSIDGQKIACIQKGYLESGIHSFIWNGRNSAGAQVASGVYFSRLSVGGRVAVGKMLLVK